MKKFYLTAVVLSVSMFALTLLAPLGAYAKSSPGKGTKVETYLVVKIVDENKAENKVEYKVISTSQFKDEEKRLKEDYTKKLNKWKDEKKTDSTKPMPVRPTIKKIGTPYKTQEGAQEYADQLKKEEAGNNAPAAKDAKK